MSMMTKPTVSPCGYGPVQDGVGWHRDVITAPGTVKWHARLVLGSTLAARRKSGRKEAHERDRAEAEDQPRRLQHARTPNRHLADVRQWHTRWAARRHSEQ
jgi:hypothetical protein